MYSGPLNWLRGLTGKKEFDCEDIKENCSEYVDEEMSAEATRKFEAHTEDCQDCGTFVKTFRAIVMTARDLSRRAAPPGLVRRIQERTTGRG